jgi:hypothetical protein
LQPALCDNCVSVIVGQGANGGVQQYVQSTVAPSAVTAPFIAQAGIPITYQASNTTIGGPSQYFSFYIVLEYLGNLD